MIAAAEGYTVVLCVAPGCRAGQPNRATAALRDYVRSSRHGVLIVSGCSLGPATCRLRPAGPLVLVQPCDTHRRPIGPAIRVGPIRSDDDLIALQKWIRVARFDPTLLPPHLAALDLASPAVRHN